MYQYTIRVVQPKDKSYSEIISYLIWKSAQERGVGVAQRSPQYISEKMDNEKGIIAFNKINGEFVGFCYIESWSNKEYVANSGLVIDDKYRGLGLARLIKEKAFNYSRKKFPDSKIFSITTSDAVMKINNDLGYKSVSFNQLTNDEEFWQGCSSCNFYDVLQRTNKTKCLCNGMLYDPNK